MPRIFSNWYERATVRSSPHRVLSSINQHHFFSPRLAPFLTHPHIQKLAAPQLTGIEVQLLFYYLKFTEYLETRLVNNTLLSIVNDEFPFGFDASLKNEAYKIYCDEAYHALQSHDMIRQIMNVSHEKPLNLPIALEARLKQLENNFRENLAGLFNLFFVCVAETLVSQELREHNKDDSIHPCIQAIMHDHAKDEATHALFFNEVMVFLSQKLPKNDFQYFVDQIPLFLEAYLIPQKSNLAAILSSYLSDESIEDVFNDCLSEKKMKILVSDSSTMLNRTISEILNKE